MLKVTLAGGLIRIGLLFLLLPLSQIAYGQSQVELAMDVYPAGILPTVGYAIPVTGGVSMRLMLSCNVTNRRDWGRHDQEDGHGPGIGAELPLFPATDGRGLFFGPRIQLFRMVINWEDKPDCSDEQCAPSSPARMVGQSRIIVVQPMGVVGYRFERPGLIRSWFFRAGLGAEINAVTLGDDVGEGAIFIVGAGMGF